MLRKVYRKTYNVWFEANREEAKRVTIGRMVKEESWSTASHSELRLIEKKRGHLANLLSHRDVKESLRKTYNEGLKRGITENRVERSHGTAERLSSLKLIQSERCWEGFIVTPITIAIRRPEKELIWNKLIERATKWSVEKGIKSNHLFGSCTYKRCCVRV